MLSIKQNLSKDLQLNVMIDRHELKYSAGKETNKIKSVLQKGFQNFFS